jgi:hypothetical protein
VPVFANGVPTTTCVPYAAAAPGAAVQRGLNISGNTFTQISGEAAIGVYSTDGIVVNGNTITGVRARDGADVHGFGVVGATVSGNVCGGGACGVGRGGCARPWPWGWGWGKGEAREEAGPRGKCPPPLPPEEERVRGRSADDAALHRALLDYVQAHEDSTAVREPTDGTAGHSLIRAVRRRSASAVVAAAE